MRCSHCDTQNADRVSRCHECGTKLSSPEDSESEPAGSRKSLNEVGGRRTSVGELGTDEVTSMRIPYLGGFVSGAVVFLLGYVVTFLLTSGAVAAEIDALPTAFDPPATWQGVGWVFYHLHNVPTALSGTGVGTSPPGVAEGSLLILVPIVLLLVAGYVLASGAGAMTPLGGFSAGATVTTGYLIPASVVAYLATWRAASFSVGPKLTMAVFVAGILYPLVFAGIGGGLRGLVN